MYYKFTQENIKKYDLPDELKKLINNEQDVLEDFFKNMNNRLEYNRKKIEEEKPEHRSRPRHRPKVRESGNNTVSGDINSLDPIDIVR
jgi:hypothetical protein